MGNRFFLLILRLCLTPSLSRRSRHALVEIAQGLRNRCHIRMPSTGSSPPPAKHIYTQRSELSGHAPLQDAINIRGGRPALAKQAAQLWPQLDQMAYGRGTLCVRECVAEYERGPKVVPRSRWECTYLDRDIEPGTWLPDAQNIHRLIANERFPECVELCRADDNLPFEGLSAYRYTRHVAPPCA
jgi:hypothetical protein